MIEEKDLPVHKDRLASSSKTARQEQDRQKLSQLRQHLALTFETPDGIHALRFLMNLSGFHKNPVGGNPALGMDVSQGTIYNCGRESIYLELRALLPPRILKQIEYDQLEEELL